MRFTVRAAVRSIARNKVRSFLTTLGIIIGVAAVIAMIAIGQGATVMVQIQIGQMGTHLIMVNPGSSNRGGVKWGQGSRRTLVPSDVTAILDECKAVADAAPVVRGMVQCVCGDRNWAVPFYGTTPSYLAIRSWALESGDIFSERDIRSANRVCVLGKVVAGKLFLGADPVGKTIRIKKMPFKVIGVLKERGANVFGDDQDDIVVLPYSTAQKKLLGIQHLHTILASAVSSDAIATAKAQIEPLLRQRHGIHPGEDSDFTLRTLAELIETTRATLHILTIFFVVVASISLVVGGIGIMNIMLVSVTERTREIGIRRAIGARRRDILLQFLVEAIVLSGIGGVVGIALGVGSTIIMSQCLNWPTLLSPISIVGAFTFSAALGIFFGFYPARKAAMLNPIDALRYE